MGAFAVSAADERKIEELGKKLGVRSKASVLRLALKELEQSVRRRETRSAIRKYVREFGELDRRENAVLSSARVGRNDA